jgi:hypothetical protein
MEKDDPHLYTFRKVLGRHQGEGIECRFCNLTSFHPNDIENRYCGYCDIFHDDISEVLTRAVAGELPREWGIRWPLAPEGFAPLGRGPPPIAGPSYPAQRVKFGPSRPGGPVFFAPFRNGGYNPRNRGNYQCAN